MNIFCQIIPILANFTHFGQIKHNLDNLDTFCAKFRINLEIFDI